MKDENGVRRCARCRLVELKAKEQYCIDCRQFNFRARTKRLKRLAETSKKVCCRIDSQKLCRIFKIKSTTCAICKAEDSIQRHHINYDFPWLWIWLCQDCHVQVETGEKSLHGVPIFDALEFAGQSLERFKLISLHLQKNRFERYILKSLSRHPEPDAGIRKVPNSPLEPVVGPPLSEFEIPAKTIFQ